MVHWMNIEILCKGMLIKSIWNMKFWNQVIPNEVLFFFLPVNEWLSYYLISVQFSSVAQSCPILSDLMDCSTPGFPVNHQVLELTQTHVHRVGDAIQPSHPLSSLSPPAFNLSQHQGFSNESVLHIRWPKYWNFSFSISPSNEYSGLISFKTDWLDPLVV